MRETKINRANVTSSSQCDLSILRLLDHTSRDPAGQYRGDECSEMRVGVRGGDGPRAMTGTPSRALW